MHNYILIVFGVFIINLLGRIIHELSHAIMCIYSGQKIRSLRVYSFLITINGIDFIFDGTRQCYCEFVSSENDSRIYAAGIIESAVMLVVFSSLFLVFKSFILLEVTLVMAYQFALVLGSGENSDLEKYKKSKRG